MTGWILSVRHRYVTDLIISSDSVGNEHFSDYHRFFSQAVWDIDHLWKLLATLIVDSLIGKEATIVLAGDDTLCRKRGLGIVGTGMHHDPLSSSKSKKICHWGHDWDDFVLVADSLYSGKSVLATLPSNFDLIGPVHARAALYAPASPQGKSGRGPNPKKGDRLKSIDAWEKDR